jgi:hypothetical protein
MRYVCCSRLFVSASLELSFWLDRFLSQPVIWSSIVLLIQLSLQSRVRMTVWFLFLHLIPPLGQTLTRFGSLTFQAYWKLLVPELQFCIRILFPSNQWLSFFFVFCCSRFYMFVFWLIHISLVVLILLFNLLNNFYVCLVTKCFPVSVSWSFI